jgi:hypothetical protein
VETTLASKLIDVSRRIRMSYPTATYDHRPFLPRLTDATLQSEEFRVGYACFKRAVAEAIVPARIIEIGMGLGISAAAFLDACPEAIYLGIDNDHDYKEHVFPVRPTVFVRELLASQGRHFDFLASDSQHMTELPRVDLVHIDGCHDYFATIHDVLLAWDSGAPWILIDDCRDSTVAAAVLWVVHQKRPGSFEWAYFEDTYTGSILISREVTRP